MKSLDNNSKKNSASELFEKSQKTFSRESLSNTQKETMLSAIYEADGSTVTPTEIPLAGPTTDGPIVSPFSRRQVLFRRRSLSFALLALVALTGTTYASATSLPGDFLYKVKTTVIEPITTSLKRSHTANVTQPEASEEATSTVEETQDEEDQMHAKKPPAVRPPMKSSLVITKPAETVISLSASSTATTTTALEIDVLKEATTTVKKVTDTVTTTTKKVSEEQATDKKEVKQTEAKKPNIVEETTKEVLKQTSNTVESVTNGLGL